MSRAVVPPARRLWLGSVPFWPTRSPSVSHRGYNYIGLYRTHVVAVRNADDARSFFIWCCCFCWHGDSRTGAEFSKCQPLELLGNLRWLPTPAANPRPRPRPLFGLLGFIFEFRFIRLCFAVLWQQCCCCIPLLGDDRMPHFGAQRESAINEPFSESLSVLANCLPCSTSDNERVDPS